MARVRAVGAIAAVMVAVAFVVPAPASAGVANGRIAFGRFASNFGIGTIQPDGSGLTKLTSEFDYSAVWSPDGQRIAFVRFRSSRRSIVYVMRADGGNLHRIFVYVDPPAGSTTFLDGLDWSPDGSWIAMTWFGNDREEIWAIHPDGSGLAHLTDGIRGSQAWPAYSPDSTMLAFRGGGGQNGFIGIFTVGLNHRDVLYRDDAAGSPSFADATHIVFSATGTGSQDLFEIGTDATGLTDITPMKGDQAEPFVSPDGTAIVYIQNFDLFTVPIAGGTVTRLTKTDVWETEPSWGAA